MDWKKLGKAVFFPHRALLLILLPVAAALLGYSMAFVGTESAFAYFSYVLAAYTLTIWCCKIPNLICFFKRVKAQNKYAQIWFQDTRFRFNVSLYGSLIWNGAYAIFQLGLGIRHRSVWFYSLAGYYGFLAGMRLSLVRYARKHKPGEKRKEELLKYRSCGIAFLLMNLALSVMILFMVYWNRTWHHHEITTIAMAAYTFGSFIIAIRNVIKYRKYDSPVYSASKAISLGAACVSMLTLESTMLTTFGGGEMDLKARRIMLGVTGGVVSVFIIVMAVYMIARANEQLKENPYQTNGGAIQ